MREHQGDISINPPLSPIKKAPDLHPAPLNKEGMVIALKRAQFFGQSIQNGIYQLWFR